MIKIWSADGSHLAVLTPSPRGDAVWVSLSRMRPSHYDYGCWFMDGPLHVVRDKVYDIVWPLTKEVSRLVWDAELRRVVRRSNYSGSK